MNAPNKFVAQLIEASAVGYAGLTTALLFDRHPELAQRYASNGFGDWNAQFQRWLIDLSAALNAGEPAMFAARMLWVKKAFTAREVAVSDLQTALEALRDTLRERLPDHAVDLTLPTVERALAAIASNSADDGDDIDSGEPAGREALSFVRTVLEGDPRAAINAVLETANDAESITNSYLNVLMPAQREVGRMWHNGELSIAEEHLITTTTQRLMALLCERARPAKTTDKVVVLACVAGNAHDLGIRTIADFFEMSGWRAINLGPDVPHDEIARGVQFFGGQLVVLAATLDPHLRAVEQSVERIRALEQRPVKIIVGGPIFDRAPHLCSQVGADGHSPTVEGCVPLGEQLLESPGP